VLARNKLTKELSNRGKTLAYDFFRFPCSPLNALQTGREKQENRLTYHIVFCIVSVLI